MPETPPEKDPSISEEKLLVSRNTLQTIVGKDGAEMVLIPAGEFQMGSNHTEDSAEKPVHTVHIDAFYIDKYEVTVGQYNQFIRATGHRSPSYQLFPFSPTDRHPMIYVSWHDAMAYAKWAGKRLPTEAEWGESGTRWICWSEISVGQRSSGWDPM